MKKVKIKKSKNLVIYSGLRARDRETKECRVTERITSQGCERDWWRDDDGQEGGPDVSAARQGVNYLGKKRRGGGPFV